MKGLSPTRSSLVELCIHQQTNDMAFPANLQLPREEKYSKFSFFLDFLMTYEFVHVFCK